MADTALVWLLGAVFSPCIELYWATMKTTAWVQVASYSEALICCLVTKLMDCNFSMLLNGEKVYFFNFYIGMSIVGKCIIDVHRLILTADAGTLCDAGNKLRHIARTVQKWEHLNIATITVLFLLFSSTFYCLSNHFSLYINYEWQLLLTFIRQQFYRYRCLNISSYSWAKL